MPRRSRIGEVGRVAGVLVAPLVALGVVWVTVWVLIGVAWLLGR